MSSQPAGQSSGPTAMRIGFRTVDGVRIRTIIAGLHDRVVPLANAEFLDVRLPDSRIATVDTGHFVWEEAPTEYSSIILNSARS
jgi:pimeloyl-ACP methyl ester carboxylesterase